MAFKMRSGNSPLEFKQVGSSPVKQTYDASETDERVYDIDQNKYDKWRGTEDINTGEKGNAPNIRYLGSKENKKHLEDYLKLGITLANLTQAERDDVQEMLDKTLNRK